MRTAEPVEPENVYLILSDGTQVPCDIRYEGASVCEDDGMILHDWSARPRHAFSIAPDELVKMHVDVLPGRTTISLDMKVVES